MDFDEMCGAGIFAVLFIVFYAPSGYDAGSFLPDENTVNPNTNGVYECGADGEYIELINNPNATTTTHRNLINFLKSDKTDEIIYEDGVFVCADCAEMLHNNAEDAEIKAGWVAIEFEPWVPTYTAEPELRYRNGYNRAEPADAIFGIDRAGHACNVFEMGDGELVFVDCTNGGEPGSFDAFVEVENGRAYIPKDINKNSDFYYESMGIVENYIIYW